MTGVQTCALPISTTKSANKIKYELMKFVIKKHNDLYKLYFDETVSHLLNIAKKNKEEEQKRINSIDYRLGNAILKPLRWLKSKFR